MFPLAFSLALSLAFSLPSRVRTKTGDQSPYEARILLNSELPRQGTVAAKPARWREGVMRRGP